MLRMYALAGDCSTQGNCKQLRRAATNCHVCVAAWMSQHADRASQPQLRTATIWAENKLPWQTIASDAS